MMSGDKTACGGMEPSLEKCQKQMHCLCQQIKAYEKQMECVQAELDDTRSQVVGGCREMEDMRRKLNQRDDAISCQENRMEELKYEMKERERNNQRNIEQLQEKLCKTGDCLNQKEQALLCCKTENNQHCANMEEMKNSFACEMQQRDSCIRQMKDEMTRLYDDLRAKCEKSSCLDKELVDSKSRLHQSCGSLKECDTRIGCLQEKIQTMECQNVKEKTQIVKEIEDRDRRLQQCNDENCAAQNQIKCLTRALQERDEEIQALTEQRDNCCRDLANEKEESCSYRERALNFENDNKEICRLLQQKVKRIKELEQILCCKEQELEQCSACVEELNTRIRRMNTEQQGDGGADDAMDIQGRLNECKNKLKSQTTEFEDTKKKLDWAVKEMECLAKEVKRLSCELERSRKETCEKNSLIEDLQQVIQHAEHDLESRMRRADEQLQCYERDIQEKTRMLSDCEEKVLRFQHCLADKELELDQITQKMHRVCGENACLGGKARELEEARDCLQRTSNEQRAQLTELCQELRVLKEQFQSQQNELCDIKRKYDCCTRDMEKCVCEYDNTRRCLQEKQSELQGVMEEKNCALSKLSSMQCRFEMETQTLGQQMCDLKGRLESEVEQLKSCQVQLEDSNSCLMQKVSSGQRSQSQMEKAYTQKLDAMCRENNMIRTKMGDREDQLQAMKDCLTVKESELMRLNLRLCSMDRCNSNNPVSYPAPEMMPSVVRKATMASHAFSKRPHSVNQSTNNLTNQQSPSESSVFQQRNLVRSEDDSLASNQNPSGSPERLRQREKNITTAQPRRTKERGADASCADTASCVDKGTPSPFVPINERYRTPAEARRARSCGPNVGSRSSSCSSRQC